MISFSRTLWLRFNDLYTVCDMMETPEVGPSSSTEWQMCIIKIDAIHDLIAIGIWQMEEKFVPSVTSVAEQNDIHY